MIERLLDGAAMPPDIDHVQWSVRRWSWPDKNWQPPRTAQRAAASVPANPPNPPFEATWSFSALLQGRVNVAAEEGAASDETAAAVADAVDALADAGSLTTADASGTEPEHAQLAWLAPIAGADFGNAVHAMFERREVGKPMRDQLALIERCLRAEGVGLRGIALDDVARHLAARLQATLDAPLLPNAAAPTLGALPASAMCAEMPFEFALGEVSMRRLRKVCDFVPPASVQQLRGLMTGKIDLVFEHAGRFHVLDYKSNRLGSATRLSDYAAPQLERAMADDYYRFQALLYTIAVDRFLRQRVSGYRRDRLGEAIYLFVRAVGIAPDAAPRAGIWAQRFDDALIDAVDAVLAGDGRQAA
jgi:exodeoxyribonuclease V beta subunit